MKSKHFVRPTCSKPWYFTCVVCTTKHHKWGAHFDCYKRFCDCCQTVYKTPEKLKEHAEVWHKKNFCVECNMTIINLKKHQTNYH